MGCSILKSIMWWGENQINAKFAFFPLVCCSLHLPSCLGSKVFFVFFQFCCISLYTGRSLDLTSFKLFVPVSIKGNFYLLLSLLLIFVFSPPFVVLHLDNILKFLGFSSTHIISIDFMSFITKLKFSNFGLSSTFFSRDQWLGKYSW